MNISTTVTPHPSPPPPGEPRPTPGPAAAVATGAGVIGGTAMAAAELAKDSVGSKQVKDGAVRTVDLAPNSVTSSMVVDGTIRGTDLKDDTVTGREVDEQTLGQVPKSEFAEAARVAAEALTAGCVQTANALLGMSRASVTATGELKSPPSKFAVSAAQPSTSGRYIVDFGGPILGCTLMASVGHNETSRVFGSASVWIRPFPENGNGGQVVVETHVPGAADSEPDPAPFNVLVTC